MTAGAGLWRRVAGHLPLALTIMIAITIVDVAIGRLSRREALAPSAIALDFALALVVSVIMALAFPGRQR